MSKKADPPAIPEHFANLIVIAACTLSKDTAQAVGKFNDWVRTFSHKVGTMFGDRAKLAANFLDVPPRKAIEENRALERRRADLQRELVEGAAARPGLLKALIPDYESAVQRLTAEHDRVLSETIASIRESGADAGIPAFGNPSDSVPPKYMAGTDAQVRHYACQQLPVAAAAGQRNKMREALESVRRTAEIPFAASALRIHWPDSGNSLFEAFIREACPPVEAGAELSENAQRIRSYLDLDEIAATGGLKTTLEQIVAVLPMGRGWSPSFTAHNAVITQKLLPLLERLPQTESVQQQTVYVREHLHAMLGGPV